MAEIIEIFFVDTTPFVKEYFNIDTKGHVYDWRDVGSQKKYTAKVLKVSCIIFFKVYNYSLKSSLLL